MSPDEAATEVVTAIEMNDMATVARYLDKYPVLLTLPWGGFGQSLLHVSAERGLNELIRLLLDRGVPIDLVRDGKTALHIAVRFGPLCTIQLLLTHGANPNALTSRGESPLALLRNGRAQAGEDDENEVLELLLRHGALTPNIPP